MSVQKNVAFLLTFQSTTTAGAANTATTPTVSLSGNGAAAATSTNAAAHLTNGLWKVQLTAAEMNFDTVGWTTAAASCVPAGGVIVTEADYTVTRAGKLDNADVATSTRMATFTLPTNFSALAVTAGGAVTAGTVSDKTGYTLTQAFPTNFAVLSISATTGLVDVTQTAADKVWGTTTRQLTGTQTFNLTGSITGALSGSVGSVTGAVGSVTGNVGGNVVGSVASVTAGVTVTTNNDKTAYALTAADKQAIWDLTTAAQTTAGAMGKLLVDNVNATISSRSTYAGGAVASVTGNVGGNVVGSVGSVTGAVGSVAAGGITAASHATNSIDANALATDAVTEIVAAVFARAFSAAYGSLTFEQITEVMAAILAGKVSGLATGAPVFRNLADSANAVSATTDTDGNRTAVTLTP